MKTALSVFFALLGLGFVYLYAVEAREVAPAGATLVEQVIGPIEQLRPLPILCVQGALVAFLVAFFFHSSARSLPKPVGSSRVWNALLEPAFALNVVLVGGIIAVFAGLGFGWIHRGSVGDGTLGALFSLALAQLVVGFGLAVALGRQRRKRRGPYYSFLTLLVCETGMLGAVLALGLQG